jgi:fatty acid desaturase
MPHPPPVASLQAVARALRVPLKHLFRDFDDIRRYTWHSGTCLVLMYGLLAAAVGGLMTPWLLLLFVPPLYVRSALHVHELMHVRSERQVPLLHRLMMALESPFCLGYREHRDIHLRHHRFCATEDDPEFFQIKGGHARAFAAALVSPEWMLVDYVRQHGTSRTFLTEAGVRCAAFVAVCALNPVAFAFYWGALRVSVGASQYVFHHVLHQRNGALGTYALQLPPGVQRALATCLGAECLHILTEHPAHHAWQVVKPDQLPAVAVALEPAAPLVDTRAAAGGAAGLGA